jgi:CMP/dCMP kinase
MKECIQIAIDGPAVSGKSTAAKHLAQKLAFLYLDSGAIYRAITLSTLRGFSLQGDDLELRLDQLEMALKPSASGLGCRVYMKSEDVSEKIRTQHVTDHIRPISGSPAVRAWVVEFLQQAAKGQHVVMDGRDIGSVVFPEARYKFYVTASMEVRVQRRMKDLKEGEKIDPLQLAQLLAQRDESDRQRKIGPLVQASDAVLIDNSELGLSETVAKMMSYIVI